MTTENARGKERIETVARLSRLVSSSLDVDRALTAVADAVRESFDAPGVFFWTADESARRLALRLVVPAELAAGLETNTMSYDQGVGVFDTIMCGVNASGHGNDGRAFVFASLSAVHSHQCSTMRFKPLPLSHPPKL